MQIDGCLTLIQPYHKGEQFIKSSFIMNTKYMLPQIIPLIHKCTYYHRKNSIKLFYISII